KVEDTAQDAPQLLELNGVVKSISATQLVVTNAQGKDFTLDITDQTIIRKNGKTATAADLANGDRVEVKVLVNGTSDTAIFINAEAMPPANQQQMEIKGTVSATGSGQITVTTKSGDVVVQIDSNTKIRKGDQTISAGDINVGDQVEATGTRVDATTMLAKKISV